MSTAEKNKIYEKIADACENDIETLLQCADDYKTQKKKNVLIK